MVNYEDKELDILRNAVDLAEKRVGKKTVYVAKVRALRRLLKIAKDRKDLTNPEFWALYKKVGGNTVRNKAHLRTLMDEIKEKRKD